MAHITFVSLWVYLNETVNINGRTLSLGQIDEAAMSYYIKDVINVTGRKRGGRKQDSTYTEIK